mmetsp:Transcript_60306/g.119566  ORF Transcript_60306/g.119566 Transcript_60306/m.119566 type:complete len:285 (+) Transcript_60306:2868-3722(+)
MLVVRLQHRSQAFLKDWHPQVYPKSMAQVEIVGFHRLHVQSDPRHLQPQHLHLIQVLHCQHQRSRNRESPPRCFQQSLQKQALASPQCHRVQARLFCPIPAMVLPICQDWLCAVSLHILMPLRCFAPCASSRSLPRCVVPVVPPSLHAPAPPECCQPPASSPAPLPPPPPHPSPPASCSPLVSRLPPPAPCNPPESCPPLPSSLLAFRAPLASHRMQMPPQLKPSDPLLVQEPLPCILCPRNQQMALVPCADWSAPSEELQRWKLAFLAFQPQVECDFRLLWAC